MADTTDPSTPPTAPGRWAPAPPSSPLGSVYSSLDAPPPPFQLRSPGSAVSRLPTQAPARRRPASRQRRQVKPATVALRGEPTPPGAPAPSAPTVQEQVGPARHPEGTVNPGVVVAVAVSLAASAYVYAFTIGAS